MYQRILIATDGSDTSERALREAILLARNQQALLRVAYVVDEASIFSDAEFVDRTAIERAWIHKGHAILEKAKKAAEAEGITIETKMLETESLGEKVAHAIVEEARHWPADLIVVGTHGRKGLRHLLVGSIAEGVIRDSHVPILLVRLP
ncbi:MAG: universal stress protein [Betaproteobacteria bacterium]|nr:universal stress protein [Betaproteobacteria bacterium]